MNNIKNIFIKSAVLNRIFTLVIFTLFIASCTDDNDLSVTDTVVVESYLVPGLPVSVKLSRLKPFVEDGIADTSAIDSARIFINFSGNDFLLTPVDTTPGEYICEDTSLNILPEYTYGISFEYNNYIVSAETVIPEKPEGLELSDIYYYYDPYGILPEYTDPLDVYWLNPDGSNYQVVVEYLDETYNPINEYLDPNNYESYRVVSSGALSTDTYSLAARKQLAFYGNYRLILYKINDEYVNILSSDLSQSTLTITEPITNIDNGLGIFTGINADTIYFKVIRL
ncbi:MAG: hypothetical protein GXO47_01285 [Chlorobi bacterium]|nr:hypothetical protein [Chlorobiota bacterium]